MVDAQHVVDVKSADKESSERTPLLSRSAAAGSRGDAHASSRSLDLSRSYTASELTRSDTASALGIPLERRYSPVIAGSNQGDTLVVSEIADVKTKDLISAFQRAKNAADYVVSQQLVAMAITQLAQCALPLRIEHLAELQWLRSAKQPSCAGRAV